MKKKAFYLIGWAASEALVAAEGFSAHGETVDLVTAKGDVLVNGAPLSKEPQPGFATIVESDEASAAFLEKVKTLGAAAKKQADAEAKAAAEREAKLAEAKKLKAALAALEA